MVSWGDARLRREIALPSSGRRQFEVHLRTADPQGVIRVRLTSQGQELQMVEAPVRILPLDEPVALCVMSTEGSTADARCTCATTSNLLPRSIRGYDAIDQVVWPTGERQLSEEQRVAFHRWQALKTIEQSGDLGLSPQPARPVLRRGMPTAIVRTAGVLAASYVACLTLAGLILTRRRASLTVTWLSAAAIVIVGSGAAHAISLVGPAQNIQVHHRSVLHQIPGTDASMLSVRGVVEFPAFDRYVVQFPLGDGIIESGSASDRPEQVIDERGWPVIRKTYGLGSRQAFTAEGVVVTQPVAVDATGRSLTVVNRSTTTLRDCRFAHGFSITEVGSLAPGAFSTAHQVSQPLGPVFTCAMDSPVAGLTSPGRNVQTHGATVIAVYQSHPETAAPNGHD